MTARRHLLVALALAAAGLGTGAPEAARASEQPAASVPANAAPAEVAPVERQASLERIDASIARGLAWLLENQRENGSWGSSASNLWDIYAPPPGSQQAFQVASVALAILGLIEVDDGTDPRVATALHKAADFLTQHYGVRRIRADVLYNTWALGYGLEAIAALLARETDASRRSALRTAGEGTIRLLDRFEFVEGGWGYYNFDEATRRPGPGATPFTTATILVALVEARRQGLRVPDRLLERGQRLLRISSRPDNAFIYSLDHRFRGATGGINKVKGSLARTPACLVALAATGFELPQARFVKSLDDLETYGHFLRIARKYPIPHETWYQNSGYFCLYGYYYAALSFKHVPADVAQVHAGYVAKHVADIQERDGSFWDYQLFGYHKVYGTGYALATLGRCRKQLRTRTPAEAASDSPAPAVAAE